MEKDKVRITIPVLIKTRSKIKEIAEQQERSEGYVAGKILDNFISQIKEK